jgi:signal transduction histidine kinase
MIPKTSDLVDRKLGIAGRLPLWVARIRASIHTKLLIGFLTIVALMLILGAIGLRSLQNADARATELVRLERQISAYRQLQHNATGQLYATASSLLATDAREIAAAERQLDRLAYDFERAEFISNEDARLLAEIAAEYSSFIATAKEVIDLVADERRDEALSLHHDVLVPMASTLERNAYTLVNLAESSMIEQVDTSARAFRISQAMLIAAALVSVVLALLLGYSLSSSLISPIKVVQERLGKIALGELDQSIDIDNRDELGDLAKNVNRMSSDLHRLYLELEEANRHKSAFLANMSHELRTPMNAIIGFNRLVMRRCEDLLPQKQYDNLGKIAVAADQLLKLINSILDLSKIEAGQMDVTPANAALAPMLTSCLRTMEPILQGKAVTLKADFADNLPVAYTDHDRLRQIVLNFLSNAAKFTDEGSITLRCNVEGSKVLISVADTGIGIPEDQQATIFDEFSQVDSSSTRKYSGTGLGLAISRQLARLLGGDVTVESVPNQGSTFTVWLPLQYKEPDDAELTIGNPDRKIEAITS